MLPPFSVSHRLFAGLLLGVSLISQSRSLAQEELNGLPLAFQEDFEKGRDKWTTTDDSSWDIREVDGGHSFAQNKRVSKYEPKVRSPHNIALVRDLAVGDFVMTFKVRSINDTGNHRDCCVFFGHKDTEHFYYVHLGAKPDPASGQIMIVDGAPRKPLTENTKLVPWDDKWHTVKLVREIETGSIRVYFDDMDTPHMSVIDKTFDVGAVGIGSFDDMNEFDDIKVYAKVDSAKRNTPSPKKEEKKPPQRPEPTVANFIYGTESERQRFDFWQAQSNKPTPVVLLIHGGGWVNGDKTSYGNRPIKTYLDAGISVAAINYRFIAQAMDQNVSPPVKACVMDAARALQTIRSKAQEWNIDPNRIGASGGSAGACTSLWLALHDDMADPSSSDVIARQSTRLQCIAVTGAQTSLDPIQLREWISNANYAGHAFGFAQKGRSRPQEFELLLKNREEVLPWIREFSPIELVTADDPPLYLEYPNQKELPSTGAKEPDPTHSILYGIEFKRTCDATGVTCILSSPVLPKAEFSTMPAYLIHQLKSGL